MGKKLYERAVFGAGCFWGIESEFAKLEGVKETSVGYMGGDEKNYPGPTYEQVCSDKTGYAEVVQIVFEPSKLTYKQLLDVFWRIHNPTTMNRQGPDFGTQYRSAIFYFTNKQKKEAQESMKAFQKELSKPIVTEINRAGTFFKAEEYHQKYLEKKGLASCQT